MEPIRVLLAGTPKLAIPSFQSLLNDNRFQIIGLLTQPDQPAGRGLKLTPPPTKVWALENNLPVWQPEKIKLWSEKLAELKPEVVVVIAYGGLMFMAHYCPNIVEPGYCLPQLLIVMKRLVFQS